MRNLTELLAATTLAGVAIWLLRKHWLRFTAISFVMGVLACTLALAPAAANQTGRALAPMLIYILMAAVLFRRPFGLFSAKR